VHPTSVIASAKDVRAARKAHGNAVKRLRKAQSVNEECLRDYQEAESALTQAKPEQVEIVQRALSRRRAGYQRAMSELEIARASERACEQDVGNKQAGFAQDELLKFIRKRFIEGSYAKNPLNLASAMAGLPCWGGEPFLSVWYSYARCSKMECDQWPNFQFQVSEALAKIWKSYQRSSSTSPIEFFRQEIGALTKTTSSRIPKSLVHTIMHKKRIPNPVRSHLVEKWVDLQLAIERSFASPPDNRDRMPFVIGTNFAKTQSEPKTLVDRVIADAAGIDD